MNPKSSESRNDDSYSSEEEDKIITKKKRYSESSSSYSSSRSITESSSSTEEEEVIKEKEEIKNVIESSNCSRCGGKHKTDKCYVNIDKYCSKCKKNGHSDEFCNVKCKKCSRYGHTEDLCYVNTAFYCDICKVYGHSTQNCKVCKNCKIQHFGKCYIICFKCGEKGHLDRNCKRK